MSIKQVWQFKELTNILITPHWSSRSSIRNFVWNFWKIIPSLIGDNLIEFEVFRKFWSSKILCLDGRTRTKYALNIWIFFILNLKSVLTSNTQPDEASLAPSVKQYPYLLYVQRGRKSVILFCFSLFFPGNFNTFGF